VRPTRINLFDEPITVTGAFLSVVAGLVSYLASEGDVVLGFVVGLQVQGLTLLVQLLLKQERRETRLGSSGELLATIESVDWLPGVVRSISTDVARIEEHYGHTVAPDAVRRVLDTCEAQLHDLARGHLYVDSYDPSLKLQLLGREASVLRTTSLQASDLAWHLSEVGRTYWRAQVDALQRGWAIQRVFIYDDWSEELAQLAVQQRTAGIEVRRVARASLPMDLRRDVTTFGDTHGYEQRVESAGSAELDRFTVDPLDIRRVQQVYARVYELAESLDE